jgi:hypothetical protein
MVQKAAAAKAALWAERDGERAASTAQEKPAAKPQPMPTPDASSKPPSSLADLKRASLARKQGLEEFAVVLPE